MKRLFCRLLPASLLLGVVLGVALPQSARAQSSDEPPPRALDHVRLQLKWLHQFQFAGYYAAIQQGYYRKAGLDVELLEATPGVDPVDVVLQGKAEFGVGTSGLVLQRAKGKPVVVLGVVYQHSPLILISKNDTGISDIHDLVGKPIMVDEQGADIYAYFNAEGVDSAKLKVLPQQFNLDTLLNGTVAATSAYSTDEPFLLRMKGVEFTEFSPREGGVDFYGDNLFTTEDQIRNHPDRVRAFRAASFQGWAYALAHKEEIVDLIEKEYNHGRRTHEQLLFEAQQTERLMHPDLIEVGYMNPGRWRHIEDTFQEQGLLDKPIELKDFMYDPNPKPDLRFLYGLLTALAVIVMALSLWILPLFYLAHRRQKEIERRILVERELLSSMERTEEALAAQSRFLAVLSHEVRSPIGGISKLLELMITDTRVNLHATTRMELNMLQQSAQSLFELVDGLLEWSRCQADGVELELAEIRLQPLMEDLQRLFKPLAETKKLALICSMSADVPEVIVSDQLRLRQIISNLLANAIKFTDKGSVTLTVERDMDAGTGSACRLLFAVKDTGIGIPAAAMGKLFKPYSQVDSSIARKFGGSGLGLSISLHFANLLGGKITVKSEPDKGSTFTLEIMTEPVGSAPSGPARKTPADRSATAGG
jgi:signal transduction histidine kinase/ABC-type nitrate/sulfonate/bicarbonate transport system substrate-binding protein